MTSDIDTALGLMDRNKRGGTWAGRIPVPPKAHPLVKQFIKLCNRHSTSLRGVSQESGVAQKTLSDWRYRRQPLVGNLQAALNALGYELVIAPRPATTSQDGNAAASS